MTPKEEAIEKAIHRINRELCYLSPTTDDAMRMILRELLQSQTVERDEVIEECKKVVRGTVFGDCRTGCNEMYAEELDTLKSKKE